MLFLSAALLLASSALVSATQGSLGFNIGVKKDDGTCKYTADFVSDLEFLSKYTNTVRVYAASDCNTLQYLLPAIKQTNFKLFVGVWPTDDAHFQAEQAALTTYLPQYDSSLVAAVIVGSEALYRNDLTAEQLAEKINTVKTLVHGISGYESTLVGTADSWNVLVQSYNAPAIQAADIMLANAFPYWQGTSTNASSYSTFLDDIAQAIGVIQAVKKSTDFPIWVGETGWPTAGENFGDAVANVPNAAAFWQQGICAIRNWGVNVLVFEAFDEVWKTGTGTKVVESNFGVFHGYTAKYPLECKN